MSAKLTRERVQEILGRGRLDDARLVAVLGVGASEDELIEAVGRSHRIGLGAIVKRPMSSRVARLCRILSEAKEEGWGEDR
jgi:hypothetical protein